MSLLRLRFSGTFSTLAIVAVSVLALRSSPAIEKIPVDLELVIAADASYSMDIDERWLQRVGFAAAFRDPQIIQALSSGPNGRIAVTYVEWADVGRPQIVVPWTLIDSAKSANSFADDLLRARLTIMRKTSISGALLFSAHLLENSPYLGARQVIDISGDGPNNQGFPVLRARDNVLARGIVINGLPIHLKDNSPSNLFGPRFDMRKIAIYYEDCVIGGPGSFIVPVKGRDQLITGIRRKLLLEVSGKRPGLVPAGLIERARRIDCH